MEENQGVSKPPERLAVLKIYVTVLIHTNMPHMKPRSILPGTPGTTYVLFVDDGSRGNPGAGGSSAVLIRVLPSTHEAEVLWVADMSYSHIYAANKSAEYTD